MHIKPLWTLYLAKQLTLQHDGPALMAAMVGGGQTVLDRGLGLIYEEG